MSKAASLFIGVESIAIIALAVMLNESKKEVLAERQTAMDYMDDCERLIIGFEKKENLEELKEAA